MHEGTGHIPPEQWGRDHWSVIAYAFTCAGRIMEPRRLRLNGHHATRLQGGVNRAGHDDLDCLHDAAAAGVLSDVGTEANPCAIFTAQGLVLGQWLVTAIGACTVRTSTLTWAEALAGSGAALPRHTPTTNEPTHHQGPNPMTTPTAGPAPTCTHPSNLPPPTRHALADMIRRLFLLQAYPEAIGGKLATYKVVVARDGSELTEDAQRLAIRDAVRRHVAMWIYPMFLSSHLDPANPLEPVDMLMALGDEVGSLALELETLTCPREGRWAPIPHIVRITQIEARLAELLGVPRTEQGAYSWQTHNPAHRSPNTMIIDMIRPTMARYHDAMAQIADDLVLIRGQSATPNGIPG